MQNDVKIEANFIGTLGCAKMCLFTNVCIDAECEYLHVKQQEIMQQFIMRNKI